MYLISALGNLGTKYAKTRHNAAWLVVDELFGADDWRHDKYADADMLRTFADSGEEMIIQKPHTMMNRSGRSVAQTAKNQNIKSQQVIILHDDIDIPMGEFKISYNRGSAQHNGVESVTQHLGTREYLRIRIGVGHPGRMALQAYVMQKFSEHDLGELRDLSIDIRNAIESIIVEGREKAMGRYNGRG